METLALQQYRRLSTLPYAAAYADDRGGILAANDAFLELWCACGVNGPIEGRMLFTLFSSDDRQDVQDIVSAALDLPRSLSCVAKLVDLSATALVELVPIHRRSSPDEIFWLVTLRRAGFTNPFRQPCFPARAALPALWSPRSPDPLPPGE